MAQVVGGLAIAGINKHAPVAKAGILNSLGEFGGGGGGVMCEYASHRAACLIVFVRVRPPLSANHITCSVAHFKPIAEQKVLDGLLLQCGQDKFSILILRV